MPAQPRPASKAKPNEIDIELLADEGMRLLRLEVDELCASLGLQLLAHRSPSRTAGIVSYLSAIRSASAAKFFHEGLPVPSAPGEWGSGLSVIYEELKRDGMEFLDEAGEDLRKALGNDDVLRLADQVNRSTIQVVMMIVAACLRLPRASEPIAATVSAILFKEGLRNFCRQPKVVVRGV